MSVLVRRLRPAWLPALVLSAAAGTPSLAAWADDPRVLSGEVVDVRCYQSSAGNTGDAHVDCALSCARRGAALGILTAEGVYTITGAYTAEVNRRLIPFVGRVVAATGEVDQRDGVRTIRVATIELREPSSPRS
jgi:hypothetical protein